MHIILTDGKGTGNVIEDHFDPDPVGSKVTRVTFGLSVFDVGPSGVDIPGQYGTLHIAPDGAYSYTRTAANLWDAGFPPADSFEAFSFEVRDGNGAPTPVALNVLLLPTDVAVINGTTAQGLDVDERILLTGAVHTAYGNGGQDLIVGQWGADDRLYGGAGNDWLVDQTGNDTLDGGAGGDRLEGGAGNDTASYASAASGVVADLMSPVLNTGDAKGDTYIHIESLEGSKVADTLSGDNAANGLFGGNGADTLNGRAGDDTIEGGLGGDTIDGGAGTADKASYAGSGAGVTVNLATNVQSGGDAAGDKLSGIESLVGSAFNDQLTGDGGLNVLEGRDGDDTLDGGGGDDMLIGGKGADLMKGSAGGDWFVGGDGIVDWDIDRVSYVGDPAVNITINLPDTSLSTGWAKGDIYNGIEQIEAGAGNDILIGDDANNDFEAGDGIDWVYGGGGADKLSGGKGNDSVLGQAGDDWIEGGAGADVLDGGIGGDTVTYEKSAAAIVLNLLNPALSTGDAKGDTFVGIEYFLLTDYNDQFVGTKAAESASGWLGNDTLSGGGGDDVLHADFGNDTLNGDEGNDRLLSFTQGDDILNGGSGNDELSDAEGTNTLNGGTGDDTIYGGSGVDTANGGDDTDEIYGENGNDKLSGDAGNDTLEGGIGNDTLNGGGDNDTLSGDPGDDILNGDAGRDTLWGWSGIDKLNGGEGNDALYGGTGNDALKGDAGNDVLWGEQGDDTLTGGTGLDTFAWKVAETGKDKVTDFKLGEDKLTFDDVFDGAGSDLQDLVDAGFTAQTSGATLTIAWNGGAASVAIGGWTGGTVNSIADLGAALGANLVVEH